MTSLSSIVTFPTSKTGTLPFFDALISVCIVL